MKQINVPENEILTVTEKLYERRLLEMFALLDDYDVQATRRKAKEEGKIEAAVNAIKAWHVTLADAMNVVKLDPKYRQPSQP